VRWRVVVDGVDALGCNEYGRPPLGRDETDGHRRSAATGSAVAVTDDWRVAHQDTFLDEVQFELALTGGRGG
jgi:hypothetical protein